VADRRFRIRNLVPLHISERAQNILGADRPATVFSATRAGDGEQLVLIEFEPGQALVRIRSISSLVRGLAA